MLLLLQLDLQLLLVLQLLGMLLLHLSLQLLQLCAPLGASLNSSRTHQRALPVLSAPHQQQELQLQ
jgi:hypothetical protein